MFLHSDSLSWFRAYKCLIVFLNGEAAYTNGIVFCLTRQGLEHTIYRTKGEQLIFVYFLIIKIVQFQNGNRISGVKASVLPSSVVDRGFEPLSDQTNNGNRISDAVVSVFSFSAVFLIIKK
jgi:hypothetical protein